MDTMSGTQDHPCHRTAFHRTKPALAAFSGGDAGTVVARRTTDRRGRVR
jgi:hypothetical protein